MALYLQAVLGAAALLLAQKPQTIMQLFLIHSRVFLNGSVKQKQNWSLLPGPVAHSCHSQDVASQRMTSRPTVGTSPEAIARPCPFPGLGVVCVCPSLQTHLCGHIFGEAAQFNLPKRAQMPVLSLSSGTSAEAECTLR